MTVNEGALDRAMRILVGLAMIANVFAGLHTRLGWLGIIPLATGIVGMCPLYALFGVRTCPIKP